jgi:large subunit ribosomal protein L31
MKQKTHPEVHPVVFIDNSANAEFITTSTLKSEKTREIDGVKHYEINIEISSASHPFFTGKQVFVDTARRVEKFNEKTAKTEAAATARKGKKVKSAARATARQAKEDAKPKAA